MSSLISSLVFYGGMTAKQKIKINIDKYGKKKKNHGVDLGLRFIDTWVPARPKTLSHLFWWLSWPFMMIFIAVLIEIIENFNFWCTRHGCEAIFEIHAQKRSIDHISRQITTLMTFDLFFKTLTIILTWWMWINQLFWWC